MKFAFLTALFTAGLAGQATAEWSASLLTGVARSDGDDAKLRVFPSVQYSNEKFVIAPFSVTYHAIEEKTQSLDLALSIDPKPLFDDFDIQPYSSITQKIRFGLIGIEGGIDTALQNPLERNVVSIGLNTFVPLKVTIIPSIAAHWIQQDQAQERFDDDSLSSSVITYSANLALMKELSERFQLMLMLSTEHLPNEVTDLESYDYEYEYSIIGILNYRF